MSLEALLAEARSDRVEVERRGENIVRLGIWTAGGLAGPSPAAWMAALARSRHRTHLESLTLGGAWDDRDRAPDVDAAVTELSRACFPALRELSLGDCSMSCNATPFSGFCGDLSPLAEALPGLASLDVTGPFVVSEPACFEALRALELGPVGQWVTELKPAGGFARALRCRFPRLALLTGKLEREPVETLAPLLDGQTAPVLEQLELDLPHEVALIDAIVASPLARSLSRLILCVEGEGPLTREDLLRRGRAVADGRSVRVDVAFHELELIISG